MIDHRTARYKRKKRRFSLLTSNGPFPTGHNILQFYSGGGRGEVLERVSLHVQNCDDPVVVRGESGSGKTLLGLVLADRLKDKFLVCRYHYPRCSREALLDFLFDEINKQQTLSPAQKVPETDAKNVELIPDKRLGEGSGQCTVDHQDLGLARLATAVASSKAGLRPMLLILDSGSVIDNEFLSLIDELNSIRVNGFCFLNVVVFQRCVSSGYVHNSSSHTEVSEPLPWPYKTYTLRRLSVAEIHDYLHHHMMLFDYNQREMFTREMSYFIADRSEGVYGLINELARSAFLLAGINNNNHVSLSHLITVSSPQRSRSRRAGGLREVMSNGVRFAILVVAIVVLGAALVVTSAN